MRVSVVILNYGTEPAMLVAAVRSVLASNMTGAGASPDNNGVPVENDVLVEHDVLVENGVLVEVLVADNASPRHREDAHRAIVDLANRNTNDDIAVRWLGLDHNYGFAGGNNRAIEACDARADAIFLLNPDATVAPNAIAACVSRLASQPVSVVSVAPKILLQRSVGSPTEPILDAIGNAVNERGEAFNIGLGQPDLGQYDVSGTCFGPCFAAGLFRRSAFGRSQVGPLDESLFLYYEDVDWNWRAQLLGYSSVTEPSAIVHHIMSATNRHLGYGFKFHLTERNLLLCSLKHFERRRAASIWLHRIGGLVRGSLRGHFPLDGLRAVAGAFRRAPHALAVRRGLQRRRVRSDAAILAFGHGERTYFDAVRYEPIERDAAERFASARLAELRRRSAP